VMVVMFMVAARDNNDQSITARADIEIMISMVP